MTSSCAESRKAAYIDAAIFVLLMYFLTVHTGLVFAVSVTEVFMNRPDSFILWLLNRWSWKNKWVKVAGTAKTQV